MSQSCPLLANVFAPDAPASKRRGLFARTETVICHLFLSNSGRVCTAVTKETKLGDNLTQVSLKSFISFGVVFVDVSFL